MQEEVQGSIIIYTSSSKKEDFPHRIVKPRLKGDVRLYPSWGGDAVITVVWVSFRFCCCVLLAQISMTGLGYVCTWSEADRAEGLGRGKHHEQAARGWGRVSSPSPAAAGRSRSAAAGGKLPSVISLDVT